MLLVELLLPILGVFKVCCPVVTRKNAFFECVRIRSAARVCTIDISPGSITRSLDLYVHAHIVAEYFHNIFAHPKMCSVSVKSLEITMNKKTKTSAIERECTTNQILCEAYCIVVRLFHRSICVRSIWGQLGPSAAIRRSLSPGPRLPRSINAAVAASIPMEVVYPLSPSVQPRYFSPTPWTNLLRPCLCSNITGIYVGFSRRVAELQAVTAGATKVTIASADKDLAQLVTRRVNMLNVYTNERLGPDEASYTPRLASGCLRFEVASFSAVMLLVRVALQVAEENLP